MVVEGGGQRTEEEEEEGRGGGILVSEVFRQVSETFKAPLEDLHFEIL